MLIPLDLFVARFIVDDAPLTELTRESTVNLSRGDWFRAGL